MIIRQTRVNNDMTCLCDGTYLTEPGGHIDCHLSAKVDTIGGRVGLFSKIFSISWTMLVFSFGMSWKLKQIFGMKNTLENYHN